MVEGSTLSQELKKNRNRKWVKMSKNSSNLREKKYLKPWGGGKIVNKFHPDPLAKLLITPKHTLETVKHTLETVKHTLKTLKHTLETVNHTRETVKHTLETVKHTLETLKRTLETVKQT